MPIHPVNVEIFYWITDNFDLMVALEEKTRDNKSEYDLSSRDHECLTKTS